MRFHETLLSLLALIVLSLLNGCSGAKVDLSRGRDSHAAHHCCDWGFSTSTIEAGSSLGLTAEVANDQSIQGVTWALTAGPGSVGNTCTLAATYFAPANVSVTTAGMITATSINDNTTSFTATITYAWYYLCRADAYLWHR